MKPTSLISLAFAFALSIPLAHADSAPAPDAPLSSETVLVVGDSLSSAHRVPVESGWVALLQKRIDTSITHPPVVINASRGGKTLADALKELPNLIAAHHPHWVVLELGANDAILGATAPTIEHDLNQLIDEATAAGAKVALLGFEIPAKLDHNHSADMLRDLYKRVAQNRRVVLLPSLMAGISDKPALLLDDGVHPTAVAQMRMLDNAWPVLQPWLVERK